MYGSSGVPTIEKVLSSPHVIIVLKHIHTNCPFLRLFPGDLDVLKNILPYHLFDLLNNPPILVEGESFLSTHMVHIVIPLSKSQILEHFLSKDGIFLPKIPCYQSTGFHAPFCQGLAFMVLMIPNEKFQALQPLYNPIIYVLLFPAYKPCTFGICHQHR